MSELELKPIPNIINVDDIQEIIEINKYLSQEIIRLKAENKHYHTKSMIAKGKQKELEEEIDYRIEYEKLEKKYEEQQEEIERLNTELEIKERLINGIENRLINHFRKIDRLLYNDTDMLIEIQDLIKIAKGEH